MRCDAHQLCCKPSLYSLPEARDTAAARQWERVEWFQFGYRSILFTLFGTVCGRHDDAPPLQWVGTTEWRVPRLKARETLTVLRHVCITSPDVYQISPLVRVSTVRPSSGRGMQNAPPIYVPQACPQSAVITVTNMAH